MCLKNFFKKKNYDSMVVSGDIIAVNTIYGHYEIGNKIGLTATIELENKILYFIGGILVEVKEKEIKGE